MFRRRGTLLCRRRLANVSLESVQSLLVFVFQYTMESPSEGEQLQQKPSGAIPEQPPLPLGPPPTQYHTHQPCAHSSHGYAAPAFCSGFSSQPYPPQQTWHHDGFVLHHNPDIPPISNMLIREAEAWYEPFTPRFATRPALTCSCAVLACFVDFCVFW